MSEQLWWYLCRASGMVAAALLVAGLVLGVLLATRAFKPHDRPGWLLSMHRWLSGLAVVATFLHVAALVADSYVHFGLADVVLPLASGWRPVAVAFGVVGMYLLVLVQATSLLMRRLPKRLWRGIHYASYGMVWAAVVHAGLAGTDTSNRPYQVVAMVLTLAAVAAAVIRLLVGRPRADRPAAARPRPPRPSAAGMPTTAAAGEQS